MNPAAAQLCGAWFATLLILVSAACAWRAWR